MLGPSQKGNVMAKKDEDKRSGGFESLRDMFDGGGAGAAGASFEGSPLSTFGNTMGIRPAGSDRPNPRQSAGFTDFFDGGGYGRSGASFAGSPYSILANALGVTPYGSAAPRMALRPQMPTARPQMAAMAPNYADRFTVSPMAETPTATSVAPPAPVDVTALPPAGAMPLQDLLMIAMQGLGTNNVEMYGDPLGRGRIIR